MKPSNNLKNQLRDLIPEIFFIIEDDSKTLNFDNGFNFKGFGLVFFNKKSLLKNFKNDPKSYEYFGSDGERKNKFYAIKVA